MIADLFREAVEVLRYPLVRVQLSPLLVCLRCFAVVGESIEVGLQVCRLVGIDL